ncbi:MAG: 1-deoxy-D-xylulose-5-phosphate synthase [Candidatus Caenarcaniphilales bacterium]|nr:1-deoxy-D-xylulose-5-phosphate synthase [Candidatus Caenarcaniphilales bacterium]
MSKLRNSLVNENLSPEYLKDLDMDQLEEFCAQIREQLIEIISKTGGHIGVNLGVVELTVALYYVFDLLEDSIVWDIGHQVYIQKMLTGRTNLLREIRKNGGSPGYAFKDESPFEKVTSSHAGASLSLGLGIALAKQKKKDNSISISVIGDGSLVEGVAQEALNHLAVEKSKQLIVLNDNEIALDDNFGGIHEYLCSRKLNTDKNETYFSSLGVSYIGPIDGHDVRLLVHEFEKIKKTISEPTILHIKTEKGKGLEFMADNSPVKIHWNFPFDPKTGENTESPKAANYAKFAGAAIDELLSDEEQAILITPATLQNSGIYQVHQKHKSKSYDVSLAEQHALTLGAGFALEGVKPIVCFEATFFQRSFDQILHDVCVNNLPLLAICARSGHTGLDHLTHHALNDISYLRSVPNLNIKMSATSEHLKNLIKNEFYSLSAPTLILYPYANALDDVLNEDIFDINLDPQEKIEEDFILILSTGAQNKNAEALNNKLVKTSNILAKHVVITEIVPLNPSVVNLIQKAKYIITLEEGYLEAGFGSMILENIDNFNSNAKLHRVGFKKEFILHGTRDYIYKKYNLDYEFVHNEIKSKWGDIFNNATC